MCNLAWRWNSVISLKLCHFTLPSPWTLQFIEYRLRDNSLSLSPLSSLSYLCHLPREQVMIYGVLKGFDNQEVTTENPIIFSIHRWCCSPDELLVVFSCLALLWSSYWTWLHIPHRIVTANTVLWWCALQRMILVRTTVQQVYLDQN